MDEVKLRKDFHVAPQYGTYYYIYNTTRKPLDDPRVRKALAMAINKDDLVNKVTRGGQIPANSLVPPSTGYTPAKGYNFDPAAARKLLAEAGYPDGKISRHLRYSITLLRLTRALRNSSKPSGKLTLA